MSGMEPQVSQFLRKTALSLFLGSLWLILNMTGGIYLGWLFVGDRVRVGNIIFYVFMGGSFVLLIRFYYRTWKKESPKDYD